MRIYAQGFTVAAMIAGSYWYADDREKRKDYQKGLDLKKQEEKRDAWIKELELRDAEEKEFRERARVLAERGLKEEGIVGEVKRVEAEKKAKKEEAKEVVKEVVEEMSKEMKGK